MLDTSTGRALRLALLASCAFAAPVFAQDLTGSVADSTNTRTLAGAEVRIVELGRVTEAGRDGSFRFGDIPPGTYTVVVRYVGAVSETRRVTLPQTGTATEHFALAASEGAGADNDILVVGLAANQASALSQKRSADGVESVLSRDAIGQNPDQNVAEALRRVPGVSIQDDQGEGRFVVLRGLAPALNAVSINGARIPSPESDNRALALDTVPSELVQSIEVKKTLTPDMDGDTIGGSIEIKTTSAFDRKKDLFSVSLEGSRNDLRDKWSPKGSVDFSKLLTPDFGISGGFSYYRRRFGTDGVEASDWGATARGIAYPEEVDYRAYDVVRTRIATALSVDWRPSDTTTLYARGILNSFRDDELRSRLRFTFSPAPTSGDAGSTTFTSGAGSANRVRVRREMKDRSEIQNVYSVTAGGETRTDLWTLTYSGSYSYSEEQEPNRQDTIFDRRFQYGASQLGVTLNRLDTQVPEYSTSNPTLFANGSDPLSKIETTDGLSTDEEYAARLDVAREIPLSAGTLEFKVGAKGRFRQKGYDLDFNSYDAVSSGSLPTLAGLSRSIGDKGFVDQDPAVDPLLARGWFNANRGRLVRNAGDSDLDSLSASYGVDEDIYAGYGQARFDNGTVRAVGGVRVEHTRNAMRGNSLDTDTVVATPVNVRRSYTNWLPSLNLRFAPMSKVVLRGAVTRSLSRPNISDLAPRFSYNENDGEGEFGNPDLRPYKSWNFDAAAEWYFVSNALAEVTFFHKEVSDFIFDSRINDYNYNGVIIDEATLPQNGDTAKVTGVEMNLQASLSFLPAPFDGLLVGGNYTYVDTRADLATDAGLVRRLTLPGSSKHIWNASIGYEKGPLQIRASGTYRGRYLDEVSAGGDGDVYVDHRLLFDIGAKLRIVKGVQVTADFINIGNEPFDRYYTGTGAGGGRLAQHEEYGWTGKFGVKVTL
ncbi:TonB-dependent receptor [Sphingomonas gellani]|uniref:TonB-dependent receptor n=1 Tax=Sphingomonas gellani TaxID=1166340 RepID=A0A1H8D7X3_9SPHN|nr:TonB-dependent receptor [Sphingomonas gellani]SEN03286.1 TonB-dependent receptor [Sphingomonas gellani]